LPVQKKQTKKRSSRSTRDADISSKDAGSYSQNGSVCAETAAIILDETDRSLQSPAVLASNEHVEPEIESTGLSAPSVFPVIVCVALVAALSTLALSISDPLREFLSTKYIHAYGLPALLVSIGLLFLPTPMASVRAGRPLYRVAVECLALGVGLTTTAFLLIFADLHNRDDVTFILLGAVFLAAPLIRLGVAPRVLRFAVKTELRFNPRASRILALCESFVGMRTPPGLPQDLERTDRFSDTPLVMLHMSLGKLHRLLHGPPTLPSLIVIEQLRRSLERASLKLQRLLRRPTSKKLGKAAQTVMNALVAYLEASTLERLLHARSWPAGSDLLRIRPDDMLLADFEQAYLLLLQASHHPALGEDETLSVERAIECLRWTIESLEIRPDPEHGALGYLAYAAGLSPDEEEGLGVALHVSTFENHLQKDNIESSCAEDLAVALVAQRLWERDFYHWALELLDGIEFASKELPLARYIRSRLYLSLQNYGDAMSNAEKEQFQAMAADDAVWANAPELFWSDR